MARGTMSHRAFPWIAGGVIVLDQLTKSWVQQSMALNAYRTLLPGVLKLTHVHNTGSAFSLFRGAGVWLVFVSVVSLVAILRYWFSLQRRGLAVARQYARRPAPARPVPSGFRASRHGLRQGAASGDETARGGAGFRDQRRQACRAGPRRGAGAALP